MRRVAIEYLLLAVCAAIVLFLMLGGGVYVAAFWGQLFGPKIETLPACTPESCPPGQTCMPEKRELSLEARYEELRVVEAPPGETPVMNLPETMRQQNYLGGSCVHASTINLLRWNGLDDIADWWRENHGRGEYAQRLNSKMEAKGLKYAYTTSGDIAFLEWCARTRRGAGIGYYPNHAINLVDLTPDEAILLDNNRPHDYIHVPRREFERKWKRNYGGWAWTLVYVPPPPLPHWSQTTQ